MSVGASRDVPHSYRFVVLAVVWTSYLIVYLSRLSVGPLAPFLKKSFDLSNAQVGSLMSATAIIYAPSMIAAGFIVDRVGVRRVLIAGTLLAGVCLLVLFLAPSYPVVLVLLALSGFGCGCIYPSAVKAIMLWFPPRERGTAVGVNQSAVNVSGIAGAALLPSVAVTLGWQYGFLFVGVVALAISAVCALLYRDPGPGGAFGPVCQDAELEVAVDSGEVGDVVLSRGGWRDHLSLFRMRDIWLLCAAGFFLGVVEFSALAHMVLYLNEALAYAVVAAGGLLALCEAAGAFGKPVCGLVSDRLFAGRRKPAFLILAGVTLVTCAVFALVGRHAGWVIYPCLLVFGFAAIGWGGLYGTMAGELGGAHRAGLAAGLCSAVANFSSVVGPPVFGYLVDRTASYRPSWLLLTGTAAVSVACLALVRESASEPVSARTQTAALRAR